MTMLLSDAAESSDGRIDVLLADDDPVSRHLVCELLRQCRYHVTCVSSGSEAIRALKMQSSRPFQLVLSDVVMPDGDGLYVLKQIQDNGAWKNLPVIMMSANECEDTVRECLQSGACHYLLKPIARKDVQNLWQHTIRAANCVPRSPGADFSLDSSLLESPPALSSAPHMQQLSDDAQDSDQTGSRTEGATRLHNADFVQLHDMLQSGHLPWSTRLRIFCNLLHNTICASEESVEPPSAPALTDARQAFRNPTDVYVSSSGLVCMLPNCGPASSHSVDTYYSAPELRCAQRSDHLERQQVYALGVLLMELMLAPSDTSVRTARLSQLPTAPVQLLESMPQLAVLVLRMITGTPEDRPSLQEVADSAAIRGAYSAMLAVRSASAGVQATMLACVRRDFLQRAQKQQQKQLQQLSHLIASLNMDLLQVTGALEHVLPSPVRGRVNLLQAGSSALSGDVAVRCTVPAAAGPLHGDAEAVGVGVPVRRVGDATAAVELAGAEPAWQHGRPSACCSPRDDCRPAKYVKVLSSPGQLEARGALDGACAQAAATSLQPGGIAAPGAQCPEEAAGAAARGATRPPAEVAFSSEVLSCWKQVAPMFQCLMARYCRAAELSCGTGPAVGAPLVDYKRDVAVKGARRRLAAHLETMVDNLTLATQKRTLQVAAVFQHSPCRSANESQARRMVASVSLDRLEENLATAGVNQCVRVYRFVDMLDPERDPLSASYPTMEHRFRSKLSSICFNPYVQQQLAIADVEGCLQLWDTHTNMELVSYDEHTMKIVSVDCSPLDPSCMLTASIDTTARIWDSRQAASVSTIQQSSQVCSAVFSPRNVNLIALGLAANKMCLYDVRKLAEPTGVLPTQKAVSYVKFMGDQVLVSVVESVLQLHDTLSIERGSVGGEKSAMSPVQEFRGHTNVRNFVGLACNDEGYIFTGSEVNEVVMYHRTLPAVLTRQQMVTQDILGGDHVTGAEKPIVSCVVASQRSQSVVAGGTTGCINVLRQL